MNWNFDNSYSRLSDAFKEHIKPVAVKNPELVIINESLAKELDLDLTKINKDKLSSLQEILFLRVVIQSLRHMRVINLDTLQCLVMVEQY